MKKTTLKRDNDPNNKQPRSAGNVDDESMNPWPSSPTSAEKLEEIRRRWRETLTAMDKTKKRAIDDKKQRCILTTHPR